MMKSVKTKEVLMLNNSLLIIEYAQVEEAAALLEYLKIICGKTDNLGVPGRRPARRICQGSKTAQNVL